MYEYNVMDHIKSMVASVPVPMYTCKIISRKDLYDLAGKPSKEDKSGGRIIYLVPKEGAPGYDEYLGAVDEDGNTKITLIGDMDEPPETNDKTLFAIDSGNCTHCGAPRSDLSADYCEYCGCAFPDVSHSIYNVTHMKEAFKRRPSTPMSRVLM